MIVKRLKSVVVAGLAVAATALMLPAVGYGTTYIEYPKINLDPVPNPITSSPLKLSWSVSYEAKPVWNPDHEPYVSMADKIAYFEPYVYYDDGVYLATYSYPAVPVSARSVDVISDYFDGMKVDYGVLARDCTGTIIANAGSAPPPYTNWFSVQLGLPKPPPSTPPVVPRPVFEDCRFEPLPRRRRLEPLREALEIASLTHVRLAGSKRKNAVVVRVKNLDDDTGRLQMQVDGGGFKKLTPLGLNGGSPDGASHLAIGSVDLTANQLRRGTHTVTVRSQNLSDKDYSASPEVTRSLALKPLPRRERFKLRIREVDRESSSAVIRGGVVHAKNLRAGRVTVMNSAIRTSPSTKRPYTLFHTPAAKVNKRGRWAMQMHYIPQRSYRIIAIAESRDGSYTELAEKTIPQRATPPWKNR